MERLAAGDAGPQAYDLADALVSHDLRAHARARRGPRGPRRAPGRLVWKIVDRLRSVHRAAELLEAGVPEKDVAGALRQPPWLAKKTLAKAKTADRATLERALWSSPTSRSSYAAAATSTRTPRSRWRWRAAAD